MGESWQAKADGTLEKDEAPAHPKVNERRELLESALAMDGWSATVVDKQVSGGQFVKFESELSKGLAKFKLHMFLFPNLNWANRDLHEKRIQITRPYPEHEAEFQLDNAGDERCLLLGIYRRDGIVIFCAWDSRSYRDHAVPTSCYVRVEAIAEAMRNGFGQSVDSKNRLVCCFKSEFFHFYINNMNELHDRVVVADAVHRAEEEKSTYEMGNKLEIPENKIDANMPRNRVVYGAPGTGKSHLVNDDVSHYFQDERLRARVTFYPDYSHSEFFGAYMPTPIYKQSDESFVDTNKNTPLSGHEPVIDYRFTPGPFMECLADALLNPHHNFVLIIEELNRADAPAVFGDLFQLLDRFEDNGESKFPITMSRPARDFLSSKGIEVSQLRIPGNMYIWCTLNSADQGVMPLDAAFKRRWSFEYLPLNRNEHITNSWQIYLEFLGTEVPWNEFRRGINKKLSEAGVQEDRLIGPFFLSEGELHNNNAFKNKLLMYLREDVLRHEPELMFRQVGSFGEIVEAYDRGEPIFTESLEIGKVSG